MPNCSDSSPKDVQQNKPIDSVFQSNLVSSKPDMIKLSLSSITLHLRWFDINGEGLLTLPISSVDSITTFQRIHPMFYLIKTNSLRPYWACVLAELNDVDKTMTILLEHKLDDLQRTATCPLWSVWIKQLIVLFSFWYYHTHATLCSITSNNAPGKLLLPLEELYSIGTRHALPT